MRFVAFALLVGAAVAVVLTLVPRAFLDESSPVVIVVLAVGGTFLGTWIRPRLRRPSPAAPPARPARPEGGVR